MRTSSSTTKSTAPPVRCAKVQPIFPGKGYLGDGLSCRYDLRSARPIYHCGGVDLKAGAVEHPCVNEMRAVNGTAPPFRCGPCLGSSDYIVKDHKSVPTALGELRFTPFHVLVDAVSPRDIWVVLDTAFWDELLGSRWIIRKGVMCGSICLRNRKGDSALRSCESRMRRILGGWMNAMGPLMTVLGVRRGM